MENTVSKACSFAGHLLDTHRQHPDLVLLQVFLQGPELHHEQRGGVDADHLSGAGAEHAPAVVAAAAAHIQYPPPAQVVDGVGQAVPFPVRAPLGVDVHTEQFEGALAPGVQPLQRGAQLLR